MINVTTTEHAITRFRNNVKLFCYIQILYFLFQRKLQYLKYNIVSDLKAHYLKRVVKDLKTGSLL